MTLTKAFQAIGLLLIFLTSGSIFGQQIQTDPTLKKILDEYYEEGLILDPISATIIGDNRFNDQLANTISAPYLKKVHDHNVKYKALLAAFNKGKLSSIDKISLAIANDQIEQSLVREKFHLEYMPFDQGFRSLPAAMPSYGSGTGVHPFKTVKDYEDWLKRMRAFSDWADTAIANFNKGLAKGMILPQALVIKMISQMEAHTTTDTAKNIFYGPARNFPVTFTESERSTMRKQYCNAIVNIIAPTYQKLANYLKNDYLPKARTTSGYNSLPNGGAIYQSLIRYYTTTGLSAEEIYQIGLREVERIVRQIDVFKNKVGFTGSTTVFFEFIRTDKQFFPFKKEEQVLDSFRALLPRIEPNLKALFNIVPKSSFEVRAIEKFKASSSADNYQPGSEDGSRPGVFNVRILDPASYNSAGMESLFSHEAIPGHHFQVSLQMENTFLPKVRRYARFPVFSEGWGLYAESLGEELGLYQDPYQRVAALRNEIWRAARLVVDAGLHTGKMTREEAIRYLVDNVGLEERIAVSETERYMADPGQALAYKIGELQIKELRAKYVKMLGDKFSIRNFHDAVLSGGAMPLNLFKIYMDEWAKRQ
ncbi:MAG: DUF885 domain-containing protein [Williamsia sp.]|nr:DUF885 domain-containing protein [Williamsia sp.]